MDEKLYVSWYIEVCGELPSIEAVMAAAGCSETAAYRARRSVRAEIAAEEKTWAAACLLLEKWPGRPTVTSRTMAKRLCVGVGTAEAAIRLLARLERLQQAVRSQRGVA